MNFTAIDDPHDFLAIDDLDLASRGIVEGVWQGLHRSPFRGAGVEFEAHRDYRQGDDLRHLDTRVYARTRRICVKDYRAETNLPLYLMLDSSGSMDVANNGSSQKWAYATRCTAALARLAISAHDAAGFSLLSGTVIDHRKPRTGRIHFQNLLGSLGAARPGGNGSLASALKEASGYCRRKGLVVVFSDFFDHPEETISALSQIASARHEVVAFQILDPYELELPAKGDFEIEDAETGQILRLTAAEIREAHTRAVTAWQGDFARRCQVAGITHFPVTTADPISASLVRFLEGRSIS